MIASYLVAFGVSLVASAPTQSPDLLCPNSTFDKDIIEEYVIRSINDARNKILSGLQLNGPWQGRDKWNSDTQGYGKKLPLGKTMNLVEYDCQLEQQAKAALNPNCTYDIPNAPVGETGIFYNKDIDWDVPEIGSAVAEWLEEIDEFAVSDHAISDTNVTFQDNALREYLSLMRPPITKIGCAEVLCVDNGVNKYRAFCLTDQPPLNTNDVVYEAGKGGCKKGEQCPQGRECDTLGMCAFKKP